VYIALLENAALLVAFSTLYGLLARFRRGETAVRIRLLTGLLFGIIAIAGMLLPYRHAPGLIYDGRSIVLAMTGLFGGTEGTLVAILVAGIFRAARGGVGIWAGLATIVFCPVVGLIFRHAYHNRPDRIGALPLYALGILAHIVMLACQMLLPWDTFVEVIRKIWFPVMLIFPVATAIIGLLLRTEERRIQVTNELAESSQRLNDMATRLHAVWWTASLDGSEIKDISPAIENISGISPDDLRRDPSLWLTKVHPDDLPRVTEALGRVRERGQTHLEYRILGADGDLRWVSDHRSVTYDRKGLPIGMGGIVTDVTERMNMEAEHKNLQAQMLQAQKMEAVGRLASGVAHDFNNLLTIINNYASMALSELPPGDELRSFMKEIVDAGQRAVGLTRQLLAFSRRQVMQPEVLDLGLMITEMKKMLGRLIGEHIELRTVVAHDLWPVKADPAQVQQVIMNLVVNARDAMPQGGTLTITVQNVEITTMTAREHAPLIPGAYVVLTVSDTGCGIDPEIVERIFEPFFTTKEEGRGTGLGLSTVYGIVKQSSGFIFVHSEPGQTEFSVYLPRTEEDLAKAKASVERRTDVLQGASTVLLVEDEQAVRELIERMLTSAGYRVMSAESGEGAIAASKACPGDIDLLVTDVVMPSISGRELAGLLRREHPSLKVLYMSGYTDETIVEQGIRSPRDNFVMKPFGREQLLKAVRDALDRPLTR
jgi:PAS domain S-box-containing protein